MMKKSGMVFLVLFMSLFLIGSGFAQTYSEIISSDKEKINNLSAEIPAGKPFIIHINNKGDKTVFFPHSGQDGPEPNPIRADRYQSDTLALDPDSGRHRQNYRLYDYRIAKTDSTDYQQGTVGTQLATPFEVRITDNEDKPVTGIEVVFQVREGGGIFSGGFTSISVTTDADGKAIATYVLGTWNYHNPVGWLESGKNMQNVGLNVVDVTPAAEPLNKVTFYAYGFPDEPAELTVFNELLDSNNIENPVIHHVAEVGIIVNDKFGNPISNLPATVEVTGISDRGGTSCAMPNQDHRPMLLIPSTEYGNPVDNVMTQPTPYEEYTAYGGPMEISTKFIPVYWMVYTGGIPNAEYTLEITCGDLVQTETFLTKQMGNCDGDSPPDSEIWAIYTGALNTKIGELSRVEAWLFRLQEEAAEAPDTCGDCAEDFIGARRFHTEGGFSSVLFKINGQSIDDSHIVTTPYGRTLSAYFHASDSTDIFNFEVNYTDHPFGWETQGGCNCRVPVENSDGMLYSMSITPVLIHTPAQKIIPVTAEGSLKCDIEIPFTIDNFNQGRLKGQLYEDGILVENNHLLSTGQEPFKLFRGYSFDLTKTYTARIVAYDTEDYNTGITGDPIQFIFEPEILRSIYVQDPNAFPIMPGGQVQLQAETAEAVSSEDLTWDIADELPHNEEFPIYADIDPATGLLTVNPTSGHGFAVVVCRYKDCEYKTARIEIGCGCMGETGACGTAGGGMAELDSVNVRMSLGEGPDGRSAGDIYLSSEVMTSRLHRPEALEYSALVRGNDVITDADDALRQILAPGAFVDVVTLNAYTYEVRFYDPAEVGAKSGGLYPVLAGAVPFSVWRFEDPDASPDTAERLRVTETRDGISTVHEYHYDAAAGTWTFSEGNGVRTTVRTETVENTQPVVETVIRDEYDAVSSHVKRIFQEFSWGRSVVEKIDDPDGAALVSTYTYYEDPGDTGSYGKRKSVENPDGSWVYYEYDASGRLAAEYRSNLDVGITAKENARRITYSYAPALVGPDDSDHPDDRYRARLVTESVAGTIVSKTFHAYHVSAEGERTEITERCAAPAAVYGDPANQRTFRVYYPEDLDEYAAGRLKRLENPDGTLTSYTYETGDYDPLSRVFTPGTGVYIQETAIHGTQAQPNGIAFKTQKEITVKDPLGRTLLTETHVFTGTGYERISWKAFGHDDFGRVEYTEDSRGRITDTLWGCCGRESHTDEQGITTAWTHDDLKRVKTETRPGPLGDIVTEYEYDGSDRVIFETVTAGTLSLITSREYDLTGRLRSETDARNLTTLFDYENGGRRKIVTLPGGITEITETYRDGRTQSVTGTGVIPQHFTYGVNPDGTRWTRVTKVNPAGPMWEETTTDLLGRTVRSEKPGPEGPEISETIYNAEGQVAAVTEPGRAETLFAYSETGDQAITALDANANGLIDQAGDDRITKSETAYAQTDGAWWRETTESVYLDAASGMPTLTGLTRVRLTGLGSGLVSETESVDAHGNVTVSRTYIDRPAATATRVTDYPDSDIDAVSVTVKGLPQSETDRTGLTVTFAHDALGRRIETADPKTGTVITHYNELGQVSAVDAPAGQSVVYGYDPVTGRRITETDPAGNITRYAYNDRGRITHTWGDAPTPVWYEYDAYGRLWKMHTYRDGVNWSGAEWPADAGQGDVTTWTYDEATGLLTAKTYADGQGVSYTYETGGKLRTRTWARTVDGAPLVTTYDYDPVAGELAIIDYSDDTPDIAFTYDRAGRKETVADAAGNRTFIYDGVKLDMEIITGIHDRTIDYDYETAGVGMAGRPAGFSVGSDYLVEYGYESGRISGLNWQIGTHTGGAGYTYQDGLIHQLQFQNGPTVTYTYDPVERYKTRVKNENASGVISQYDYTHDILGRRETVTYSGSAFSQGPTYRRFAYNDRSELIESSAYAGLDIADTSSPLPPEYRSYTYDPIGNRTTSTDWDKTTDASQIIDYTANELNQYDQITAGTETDLPEYDADGNLTRISADDPLMTYNGENRLVEAEYQVFAGDIIGKGAVDLTDAISALQVAAGMTPSGVTTDGDINADGQIGIEEAVYALQVSAEMRVPAETSRKLVMAYDYMGRRVSKQIFSRNEFDTDWNFSPDKTVLFVYDGWNLVEEIEQKDAGESSRYYVWGLDLSQSFEGAGGIGGLLTAVDGDSSFRYLYDANGNVGQLVSAEDGRVSAHYEYDSYGNVIDSYGDYAVVNPFRFSTKFLDGETGFYNFGLRCYVPKLGRWSNRDPLGEEGGLNLYAFALNAPYNHIDPLGLENETVNRLVEFADRLGIAAYVTVWQVADTFNRAVFFPLVDLLSLPDEILKCVFKLTDDDLTALAAFPGGHDDALISVIVGGGKAPKIVRRLVGYGGDGPRKIVRRFDTKKNIKQVRKKGIKFDPNKGSGISATSDDIDPVDPNSIRQITGMSREPEAYVDIDISEKVFIEKSTKSGHKEYQIQQDILPSDIVQYDKVKKSRYGLED